MATRPEFTFHILFRAFALATLGLLTTIATTPAEAQTFTVLHDFTGGADGGQPVAGVTLDQQGRIYGTATEGGTNNKGVVYRVVRGGEGWSLSPIYSFGSQEHDGSTPLGRVTFGPDGLLYGTTDDGGAQGHGTVFSLRPPATACKTALCPWLETILYSFTGGDDGSGPGYGDLIFDQSGNIYGTTLGGGSSNHGAVFKLTRSGSDWTESVLWSFTLGSDGGGPFGGVIFDTAGNLYGATSYGGPFDVGTLYELSPTQSGWSETTLYSFTGDYGDGAGGLIMDAQGTLFGLSGGIGSGTAGAAYTLTQQNGNWLFFVLGEFFGSGFPATLSSPTFDSQGNLYGPLPSGGNGQGEIFKLTPSGNQWVYTPFYQFLSCSNGEGCYPEGAVTFDASGNMYGTAYQGGTGGPGTVWEITP